MRHPFAFRRKAQHLNFPRTPFMLLHLQFTIDIRPDPGHPLLCYFEETSHTGPIKPALTLALSICCGLLVLCRRGPPFVFNSLQPLFPKHPGVGVPYTSRYLSLGRPSAPCQQAPKSQLNYV